MRTLASTAVCRRYSSGSEDLLRFRENPRSDEGRESLDGHKFDSMSQALFQQVRKRQKSRRNRS
jgi:hypothetical protein